MAVRYITVTPVTTMFKPATRAFGDIAIVGDTKTTATGPKKTPIPVTNPDSVSHPSNAAGKDKAIDAPEWFEGDLGTAVKTAFKQTPGPTTVWAVRTNTGDANPVKSALAEVAKLDVQIVLLANKPLSPPNTNQADVKELVAHVDTVSKTGGDGKERIGVGMLGKGVVSTAVITSDMAVDRMVMVAHNSDDDAAAAVAGTIAGYEPHISLLLKQVKIQMDDPLNDSDIDSLKTNKVNWLVDPALLPGKGLFMGEGMTLGADLPFIDVVRTVDDISFRLKASLIRSIGNLRVSRSGLRALSSQMAAVLEPLRQREVIEAYDIFFPLLVLLDKEPADLTAVELQMINDAQNSRTIAAVVSVDYAGAIHYLNITLKFT